MDRNFAIQFANEWISAWNAHNIEQVLTHYTDNFEMNSPKIVRIIGEPSGKLKGKAKVREYWTKALDRMPDHHFELITVLVGVESVTLYYHGVGRQPAAEVFHFNTYGKVVKAYAHYE